MNTRPFLNYINYKSGNFANRYEIYNQTIDSVDWANDEHLAIDPKIRISMVFFFSFTVLNTWQRLSEKKKNSFQWFAIWMIILAIERICDYKWTQKSSIFFIFVIFQQKPSENNTIRLNFYNLQTEKMNILEKKIKLIVATRKRPLYSLFENSLSHWKSLKIARWPTICTYIFRLIRFPCILLTSFIYEHFINIKKPSEKASRMRGKNGSNVKLIIDI